MESAGPVAVTVAIRTHKKAVRMKFQKVPNSGSQIYNLFGILFRQNCADNGADRFPCAAKGRWGEIKSSAPPVVASIAASPVAAFDIRYFTFDK